MKRVQGFSLVELMISLALGALLLAAAVQLLTVNQRTFAVQEVSSGLLEDGQSLIRFLSANVRQAGHGGLGLGAGAEEAIVFGGANGSAAAAGIGSDRMAIRYVGTEDCQGSVTATPEAIINRYWVESGSLRCAGSLSGGSSVELMQGVLVFKARYGVDTELNQALGPFQYYTAATLPAGRPVVSVSLVLLMERQSNSLPDLMGGVWRLPGNVTYNEPMATPSMRRMFQTTVMLRNMNWEEI